MDDDVNGAIRNPPARLVVGISGASGAIYGARVLDALNEGEITSEELTRAHLDAIEALNPRLNAYITDVLSRARAAGRAASS